MESKFSKDTQDYAHWKYNELLPVWQKMRDSVSSEHKIKDKVIEQNLKTINLNTMSRMPKNFFGRYLIPTDSMLGDEKGLIRFAEFTFNAVWYPFPLDTHDQALGLINSKPAKIELPTTLEYMRNDATSNQESFESLLSSINSEQIITSRYGILGEATNDRSEPFNICTFNAECIVDWEVGINQNTGEEFVTWVQLLTDDYDYDLNQIFLILRFDDNGDYVQYKTINSECNSSDCGVFGDEVIDEGFIEGSLVMPKIYEKPSKFIPFFVVNCSDLGLNNVQKPWLESIADASFKTFQASARYNWALKWGGENTFWATGISKKDAEGFTIGDGGACFSENSEAKFGYASGGADGVAPSKDNVENLKAYCVSLGVDLIQQGVESGVALEVRTGIKTASLKTLAMTGAEGLEKLLKMLTIWMGGNSDDVKIIANTEFADVKYTAEEFKSFAEQVNMGQMLQSDLFEAQKKQGLTIAKDYEEWRSKMQDSVIVTNEVPKL